MAAERASSFLSQKPHCRTCTPCPTIRVMLIPVSLRLTRSVFGLFTIWCLGCASFDSLIEQLLSGRAGTASSCMTATESPVQHSNAHGAVTAVKNEKESNGCGCTQCVGVDPAPMPQAAPARSLPDTFAELPGPPLTDNREPLVPPPQLSSIG
jgi:hypothetical protein